MKSDNLKNRLSLMTEKLMSLESIVVTETLKKKANEEQKIQEIVSSVDTMQKNLTDEIKMRVESSRTIQQIGNHMLDDISSKLEHNFSETLKKFTNSLESLVLRCENFELSIIQHKNVLKYGYPNDSRDSKINKGTYSGPESSNSILQVYEKMNSLGHDIEITKKNMSSILESETDDKLRESIKSLRDMKKSLNLKLENELQSFQKQLNTIREQTELANIEANESINTYKMYIPEELGAFQTAIEKETVIREDTDDALVKALNEYNTMLQKGFSTIIKT